MHYIYHIVSIYFKTTKKLSKWNLKITVFQGRDFDLK